MKFSQLRILMYLTEAIKAELKINQPAVKDVLSKYWDEIPDDVDFIVDTLDGIDGKLFLHNDSKEKIKMFKVLKQMLPTKDDKEINKIIDEFKSKSGAVIDNPKFKGFSFWEKPIFNLYTGRTGPLSSCMTKCNTAQFTKFYDWINGDDPNFQPSHDVKVKALVHRNDRGQLNGRALVWYGVKGTGGKPFMDRSYPDEMKHLFRQYANANEWAYRAGDGGYDDYEEITGGDRISITLDLSNFNPIIRIPYMDTFVGLTKNTIYNRTIGDFINLQTTGGTRVRVPRVLPTREPLPTAPPTPEWFQRNLDSGNITNNQDLTYGMVWNGSEYIFQYKGTWLNGTWEGGPNVLWKNGTWKDGTWKNGTWNNGTWEKGTWETGHWNGGTWEYGTWENGRWLNGTWKNGTWENGTWVTGMIYDPEQIGKKEYVQQFRRRGFFVVSNVSPREYFGTPENPYTNRIANPLPEWANADNITVSPDSEYIRNPNQSKFPDGLFWLDGTWEDGIWKSGEWKDGEFIKGTWEDGIWTKGDFGQWHGRNIPEDSSVWEGGTWKNGRWKNGVWKGGTWKGGDWYYGTWKGGTWKRGTWFFGKWKDGLWEDGIWYDGNWTGGTWMGGSWDGGRWNGGKIYDPQRKGESEYRDSLEWDGDFVIAPRKINPYKYFGTNYAYR